MPILTKLNGDPASLRRMGERFQALGDVLRWDVGARVTSVREESERDWTDDAGETFQERMYNGGKSTARLDLALEEFGKALQTLGEVFELAQRKLEAARTVALQAGLTLTETHIEDPPPPKVETERGTIDYTLGGVHDRMTEAYAQAESDARVAEEMLFANWAGFRATGDQAETDIAWRAGDFTVGVARALHAEVQPILTKHLAIMKEHAARTHSLIHANTNPSLDKRLWSDYMRETRAVKEYEYRVARALKIGKGIKITGWGLVIAGMGWDIDHGEAPSKAAFKAATGLGGAHLVERFALPWIARGAWGGSRFGPWGTALGGLIGGIGSAKAGDYLYDFGGRFTDTYTPGLKKELEDPLGRHPEES